MTPLTPAGLAAIFAGDDGAPLPIVASVFTPYQLMQCERIVTGLPPRPVLLIDGRSPAIRSQRPACIPGAEMLAADLTGEVLNRDQARLAMSTLDQAAQFVGGKPFVFLCASFQRHVNTLALTRWHRDPAARLVLMDDGLSTFLDAHPSPQERAKNALRESIARLRGFPARRAISGHPLGLDLPGLHAILLSIDARPDRPTRRPYAILPPAHREIAAGDPAMALFIGQPYAQSYGWDRIDALVDAVVADLTARGHTRLGFKPHHFQPRDEIDRYLARGFELVESSAALEEMIGASPYRTIASVNTTALLTARALYGDAIRAIAYAPTAFKPPQESRDLAEVEALFRRAGVEVVDPA